MAQSALLGSQSSRELPARGIGPRTASGRRTNPMKTQTLAEKRGSDVQPAGNVPGQEQPTIDLDRTYVRAFDGGTVVFAPIVESLDDGLVKRYRGAVPLATAGTHSETDLRRALLDRGYDAEHVRHALRTCIGGERARRAVAKSERLAARGEN